MCEWCGKAAKTRCSKCRQALFCVAKCMNDMRKEHKKTCKVLSEAKRRASEVALDELGGKQPFWTGLDEIPQQIIAGYMDVVTLLVQRGADLRAVTHTERDVVDVAHESVEREIAGLFAEYGVARPSRAAEGRRLEEAGGREL